MCDIDGLKVVNDTHGHDKGNEYITLCHDIIRSSVHADDFIFRLGGDEFLVIMSNTEQRIVQERVLTIEAKMQEIKKEYNTSISLGSATATELPIDYLQLISDADQDMYKKKRQRKNSIFEP
jgi:diguanylate cyclase (GGDEF)-like protein